MRLALEPSISAALQAHAAAAVRATLGTHMTLLLHTEARPPCTPATSAPGLGSPLPTSAPGLGSPLLTSAPGLGSPPPTSAPGLVGRTSGACQVHRAMHATAVRFVVDHCVASTSVYGL